MGPRQSRRGLSRLELEDEVASDLQRATGLADADAQDANRLNRVLQLTGARRVSLLWSSHTIVMPGPNQAACGRPEACLHTHPCSAAKSCHHVLPATS